MVRIYATIRDLEAWTGRNPPGNAGSLLRSASVLVEDATLTAVYSTDKDGMPRNPNIAKTFRDATCEQVRFWADNGLDPQADTLTVSTQAGVSAKTISGAQISYDSSDLAKVRQAKLNSLQALSLDAARILRNAGLLSTAVRT